eukprot:CAMPEP_0170621634 /NCGR_PEP_ID=MMETSP0224-20130122/28703_1 /TAXON_ID=285029 /ORGANISM="Togula jolla, Strain CCCM 725" /LENGTH=493 /DNA_ID=CAMNT_0010947901 /DNA_START=93 /DNA_END=1574 /DNA_ORIENTATION=-
MSCMAESPKPSRAAFPSLWDLLNDEAHRQIAVAAVGITALVVLSANFPKLELELVLALTVAVGYAVRQAHQKPSTVKHPKGSPAGAKKSRHPLLREVNKTRSKDRAAVPARQAAALQERFRTTVRPVAPPTFAASGWEAEVDELSKKIARTSEVDGLVQGVVSSARAAIQLVIPEAEILGFASGNPMFNKAFAMAVPEIHIVMKASSAVLLRRLESRFTRGGSINYRPDGKKLHKCAIRTCTEQLASEAGFKFRRSAFVGDDPKVCLLVPPTVLGLCSDSIAIDFSVNSDIPLRSDTIMSECKSRDPRAEPLMLLVRRWARDRGIAHAARGHLSTYAWNLLTVFFMQVAPNSDSILGPMNQEPLVEPEDWSAESGSQRSIAALFQELVAFYVKDFDWQKEGISVRLGRRGPPQATLPLQHFATKDGGKEMGPSIEDPLEVTRNLASGVTSEGMSRLHEELLRANELCLRGASLKELLELWAPPEARPQPDASQ